MKKYTVNLEAGEVCLAEGLTPAPTPDDLENALIYFSRQEIVFDLGHDQYFLLTPFIKEVSADVKQRFLSVYLGDTPRVKLMTEQVRTSRPYQIASLHLIGLYRMLVNRPTMVIQAEKKMSAASTPSYKLRDQYITISLSEEAKRYAREKGEGIKRPQHMVEEFARFYKKSGKVVTVAAHKRGDPRVPRKTPERKPKINVKVVP